MAGPDLSEFEKLSQRSQKKPCQIATAVKALSKGDQAKLKAACEADRGIITTGAVVAWLGTRDLKANNAGVSSHRRGTCACHA